MIFVYKKGKVSLRVGKYQLLGTLLDSAQLICDREAFLFQTNGWTIGIRIGKFNRIISLRKRLVRIHYEPLEASKHVWYQDKRYEFQLYCVWTYDNHRLRSKEVQYRVISVDGVVCHPLFNLVGGSTPIDGIRTFLRLTQTLQLMPGGEELWATATATYLF